MTHVFASKALLPDGWSDNVRFRIDQGRIAGIEVPAKPSSDDTLAGCVIPGLCNAHSHAFQRALAGHTEQRSPTGRDSFWTWRDLMYRFLDRLTPDQMQAIAALAFMEMQEAGFAAVAEFHYVHH
ncbi:MAG: amidohydrolase family protein, partial [Woeseiaceae bacterium]